MCPADVARQPSQPRQSFCLAAALTATAVGTITLLGWIVGNDALKGLGGTITMKANTATGLIACGLSLASIVRRPRYWSIVASGLAGVAGLIGALTLVEHLSGWNLGIDQLLFAERLGAAATASPGRMGPNGASSLLLMSVALLALRRDTGESITRAQVCAAGVALLAMLALTGYWYGARELYEIARVTGIAFPTAVAFFALSAGTIALRTDVGPVAAFAGNRPGSVMARRLLPAAVALPLVIGYVRVLGQDASLYDTGFGTAMFGLALAVTFVLLIWRTARYANVVDADRQHAQAAMHASEASFATMFQSLPVGVVLKRVDDGRFVDVNDSFVAWSGYRREDLLGGTSAELGITRNDPEREDILERVPHGESLRGAESHMFTKTGQRRDVLNNLSLVQLRDTPYILSTVVDITERKRADEAVRESEERFRRLADQAPTMIFLADEAKRCVWVNRPWLQFVGRTLEQELGDGWAENLHPDDRARCFELFAERFEARQPFAMEYRLRRVDGTYRWILAHATPCFAGDAFTGYAGACIDITDRKDSEAQQVGARQAAESANHLKDQFLATLSHELRTPLNAILGYARMLRSDVIAPEKRARAIEIIERNAVAQTQLVEDLLDISRMTSGRLRVDLQPVEPVTPLREALESIRPAAEAKGIVIDLDANPLPGTVNGDASRLRQVFWNLASNAVKFTPPGGRVLVTLSEDAGALVVTVADSGIGIAREFLPHVFEPFRQADGQITPEHGGLGLGLAICKQLVELHGGSMIARSEGIGHGATFAIRLPLQRLDTTDSRARRSYERIVPAAGAVEPASTNGRLAGVEVLVVDDQADSLEMLRQLLEHAGARVRTATSAEDAQSQWTVAEPDLLVADIGLPIVDGYELLRQIRATTRANGHVVPAIAVTAHARGDDRAKALATGFQAHIAKPVDPDAFVAAVAAVVGPHV